MKPIIVVNRNIEAPQHSDVISKRNKTIIKTITPEVAKWVASSLPQEDYKYFLEEWEFVSDAGFQFVMDGKGAPQRPVHIVSSSEPPHGFKALFQVEKMYLFSYYKGAFVLKKLVINSKNGLRRCEETFSGHGDNPELVAGQVPEIFSEAVRLSFEQWMRVRDSKKYAEPLYAFMEDRKHEQEV